jgi:hypothetical protein
MYFDELLGFAPVSRHLFPRPGRGSISGPGLMRGAMIRDFAIIGPDGRPFLAADSLELVYQWRTLLAGRILLDRVALHQPTVIIERLAGDSIWNYERIFGGGSPDETAARNLIMFNDARVHNGSAVVRMPWEPDGPVEPGDTSRLILVDAPGGLLRAMRFEGVDARLNRVIWESPIEKGRLFDIQSMSGHGTDEGLHADGRSDRAAGRARRRCGRAAGHDDVLRARGRHELRHVLVQRQDGAEDVQGAIIERRHAPELYDMVDRLRQRAGLPMPTVAIAPSEQPNAFATGRNQARGGLLHRRHPEAGEPGGAGGRDGARARAHQAPPHAGGHGGRDGGGCHRHDRHIVKWGAIFGGGRNEGGNPFAVLAAGDRRADCGHDHPVRDQPPERVPGGRHGGAHHGQADGPGRRAAPAGRLRAAHPHAGEPGRGAACDRESAARSGAMRLFSTHPATEDRVERLQALAATRSSSQLAG